MTTQRLRATATTNDVCRKPCDGGNVADCCIVVVVTANDQYKRRNFLWRDTFKTTSECNFWATTSCTCGWTANCAWMIGRVTAQWNTRFAIYPPIAIVCTYWRSNGVLAATNNSLSVAEIHGQFVSAKESLSDYNQTPNIKRKALEFSSAFLVRM